MRVIAGSAKGRTLLVPRGGGTRCATDRLRETLFGILTPDLPGFHLGKKEAKMGLRSSPTLQITLDGCRVPGDRLLGAEGKGFSYALGSLDEGRLGIAAQAIGIARALFVSIDSVKSYNKTLRQKLGAPTMTNAVFRAMRWRLIE